MRDLAPPALEDAPLHHCLQRLCEQATHEAGNDARFDVHGHPQPLPATHEVALFRVAQEALTNARKHASASGVQVTLSYLETHTALDIVDDGHGFDQTHPEDGFGLRGMRERLAQFGGRLTVESAHGEGTAIAATLPAADQGDPA